MRPLACAERIVLRGVSAADMPRIVAVMRYVALVLVSSVVVVSLGALFRPEWIVFWQPPVFAGLYLLLLGAYAQALAFHMQRGVHRPLFLGWWVGLVIVGISWWQRWPSLALIVSLCYAAVAYGIRRKQQKL